MSITPEQRDAIVKPVRNGLLELVTGAPGLFRDRPGFIAGGGSNDRFSSAVRTISQLNCRIWAARDKSGYSATVNQTNAALCEPYLESIGEIPPDGSLELPFTGGQCTGQYRVTGTFTYGCPPVQGESGQFSTFATIAGPISGISAGVGEEWRVNGGGGASLPIFPIGGGSSLVNAPGPGAQCNQFGDAFRLALGAAITAVEPIGFDDNCGNPGANLEPPGQSNPGTPPPGNIEINLPGVGPITVDLELDDDGNPVICIPVIDTCFSVDVGGEPSASGGGAGVAPTTPGSPGDSGDTGDGGLADGEAEPGSELTGVLVTVVSAHPNANTLDRVPVDIYRGIGYVSMGYPGLLGVDTSAAVVESPQFFHAQQRGLTAWRVRASIGFSLRATPYYREVTE